MSRYQTKVYVVDLLNYEEATGYTVGVFGDVEEAEFAAKMALQQISKGEVNVHEYLLNERVSAVPPVIFSKQKGE